MSLLPVADLQDWLRLVVELPWKVGANTDVTMPRVVERGGLDLAHLEPAGREVETEPCFEVAEVAARSERGAREHHSLDPVEQNVLENRREIERHGRERDVHDFSTPALEPAHGRGAPGRRPQRGDEPGGAPPRARRRGSAAPGRGSAGRGGRRARTAPSAAWAAVRGRSSQAAPAAARRRAG